MGDPFQWLLPSAKTTPTRSKKVFLPRLLRKSELFLAIFNQFLRLFMTPSKVNITQNKWVRLVCLPERGTPPTPPIYCEAVEL
jgi:hypothetical protein